MTIMRSPNHHEPITPAAAPGRGIPVLVPCVKHKRDGIAFLGHNNKPFVREVPTKALLTFIDPKQRPAFEKEYGSVSWPGHLLYTLGLASAIEDRSAEDLYDVAKGWAQEEDDFREQWERIRRSPVRALGNALSSGIWNARFAVWWLSREKRFATGLYCPDALTALHALIFTRLGQPGGLGVCLRCRNPFIRSRRTRFYCSSPCQVAAAMVRYRERKKRPVKHRGKRPRMRRPKRRRKR